MRALRHGFPWHEVFKQREVVDVDGGFVDGHLGDFIQAVELDFDHAAAGLAFNDCLLEFLLHTLLHLLRLLHHLCELGRVEHGASAT